MTNKLSWKPQLVHSQPLFSKLALLTTTALPCTCMYMVRTWHLVCVVLLLGLLVPYMSSALPTIYQDNPIPVREFSTHLMCAQLCEVTCAIIVVSTVKCFNIGEFTVHYYIVFHYALLWIGAVFPELHGLVPCCLGIASCLLVCPLATIPSCQVQSCCCNKQIDL